MTTQTKTFSLPDPDPKSKDPVDQLMHLSAKWRRDRGLDDSAANLEASALAVMRANPKLAKAYQLRPTTMAKAKQGDNPWPNGEE
jgi:hypothetical protein